MKLRIIASVLLAALLFFLIPTGAADASEDVCFLSINDTLLELRSMPVFANGTAYVPNWVLHLLKFTFPLSIIPPPPFTPPKGSSTST